MLEQKNDVIRVVCISDTHTHTEKLEIPDGDILIHSGDSTYRGKDEEIIGFNNFLKSLTKFKHKIVIAGNHEITFDEENSDRLKSIWAHNSKGMLSARESKALLTDCIYLENSGVEVMGYKFWGSPMITIYDTWGFYREDDKLLECWKKIPDDTEILITHSPPHSIMDYCLEIENNEGCKHLYNEVINRIKPKFHVFGHTHEGYGTKELNGTTFINAATCDMNYLPINKPIVFDLPRKN